MIYGILVFVLWCIIGYIFSLITEIPLGYVGPIAILLGIISMNIIRKKMKK
ncbi:hypothetical protein SPIROBIBN47_10025 [uncultured spirochete]|uniref:Uncharacterized protein n=1 Tax=uncultured spirochete TaxID=156406 RepID=A0A3P3XF58_9SPIR|nr:hypothetical protein SPIROBIBN47_10025 [uncultured spirochete]